MGSVAKWLGVLAAAAMVVPATQNPGVSATSAPARPNTLLEPRDLRPSQQLEIPLLRISATKRDETQRSLILEIEGVLEEGDNTVEEDGYWIDFYSFEAQAGQAIEIIVNSEEFTPAVIIFNNASGEILGGEIGEGISVESVLILPHTGAYRIGIFGITPQSRGAYQLHAYIAEEAYVQLVRADLLVQQGLQQAYSGLYTESLNLWQEALEIFRSNEVRSAFPEVSRYGEAQSLGNLGLAYDFFQEYEVAISLYRQAIDIYRELGDREGESKALGNLGSVYDDLGQYELAINFHQQALSIARDINDLDWIAGTLNNIALSYSRWSKHEYALDFYQQALAISYEIGELEEVGRILGNLGHLYMVLGRYSDALNVHQESLEISLEINNFQSEAASLAGLGNIYNILGQYDLASSYYLQALEVVERLNSTEGLSMIATNAATLFRNRRQYDRAVDLYQLVLEAVYETGTVSHVVGILTNLGATYALQGEYELAIRSYEEALKLSRENEFAGEEAAILSGLGLTYSRVNDHENAIPFYQESLDLIREIGDLQVEAYTLNNQGISYLQIQQFEQAEVVLTQAINIFDTLRNPDLSDADKISLFDTQQASFRLLQRALVAQGKYEPALTIAERGRAQAFAELLAQQLTEDSALEPPNIAAIQSLAQQQQTTLVEYSLIRFSSNDNPVLYIWVVAPDGSISFRQQPLTDIDLTALVTDIRQSIGVRSLDRAIAIPTVDQSQSAQELAQQRAETDQKLTALHQLLIEPIADLLPSDPNQEVVFIPQSELFLVPFPALKDASGEYLIENHTILTAPSIQVLQLTQELAGGDRANGSADFLPSGDASANDSAAGFDSAQPAGRGLSEVEAQNPLIVGDPTMPEVTFLSQSGNFESIRLQPLYGARQEAQAVSDTLNASALLGDAATEARVKQQIASADLIHLATHGLLEYGDPRQTGSRDTPGAVALAPGGGEDGLLTSTEILQMELQADLVVLSACDTGRGRITGDGVIGLSRSFIAAGVPSIIVSLWAVPDAPTADLMTEFYNQLSQGETKAQALRQAMLITMQDHPDPKDWAAFTLIGNAE